MAGPGKRESEAEETNRGLNADAHAGCRTRRSEAEALRTTATAAVASVDGIVVQRNTVLEVRHNFGVVAVARRRQSQSNAAAQHIGSVPNGTIMLGRNVAVPVVNDNTAAAVAMTH